jgi:twitching motility protein PilT
LPHKSGIGRVIATEVCIANTAIRRTIRSKEFIQLTSIMQTGAKSNMHIMQDSVTKLFENGLISSEIYDANVVQSKG